MPLGNRFTAGRQDPPALFADGIFSCQFGGEPGNSTLEPCGPADFESGSSCVPDAHHIPWKPLGDSNSSVTGFADRAPATQGSMAVNLSKRLRWLPSPDGTDLAVAGFLRCHHLAAVNRPRAQPVPAGRSPVKNRLCYWRRLGDSNSPTSGIKIRCSTN